MGQKEKSNTVKTNNITRENKSESTGKRRKAKKIPRLDKTIQTKQDILKQRNEILPTSRGKMHEYIQQHKPSDRM